MKILDKAPFMVLDGGLSTALELLGHHSRGLLWTARLLLDQPEVVVAAHRSFVEAGAEVLISASYQASLKGFIQAGCSPQRARQLLASTTQLARQAGAPLVAASIGPFGATLGDGSEYHGRYDASWPEIRRFHRERIAVLADTGPDLFAVETIPSSFEAEIILEELQGKPAWLAFSCSDERHTCGGEPFSQAVARLNEAHLLAIGINCTDPKHVTPLLQSAATVHHRPWVVYPNHGQLWDPIRECWSGDSEVQLEHYATEWVKLGARLIGGCCGTGPEHIRALVKFRQSGSQFRRTGPNITPPA